MEQPKNFLYQQGNMFTTSLPAIGHGVNVEGVMATGVAKYVKDLYPDVRQKYIEVCAVGDLKPGEMLPVLGHNGKWILNLASQDRRGPNARLEWLSSSLEKTFQFVTSQNLSGFALPKIGAGIGGLNWDDVEEIIFEQTAKNPDVLVEVWVL